MASTVVVGLDGAGFDLVERWMADGTLPNLAELRSGGAAMELSSWPPPVTCPNWQCYATGTNPGKLGVFWWERVDREGEQLLSTAGSEHFDGVHYWTQFDDRVAVVNLPTSYPPPVVDGIHVAGGPGAEGSGYTTPRSLERELESEYGYRVHPPGLGTLDSDSPESDCVDAIYELIDTRFAVVEDLLDAGEYGFVHLTVFYINVLQHFFWDHEVVKRAWKRIDDHLGTLLDRDDVGHLFVMSDHGSNAIETRFNVNQWLVDEGYLVTETGVSDALHRLGLTQRRLRSVLSRLRIERAARRLVPRRIQTLLPRADGTVFEQGKSDVIDWEESRAVASGQGPLWVLSTEPAERARVREELRQRLDGLSTPAGREVIASADPAADVYHGPHVERGPDLVLRQAPGVHIDDRLGSGEVFARPTDWRAENTETGLCIAYGPSVDPSAAIQNVRITDIAPTVTHLRGYPVPENFDGAVRTELFAAGSEPADRPVESRPPLTGEAGRSGTADERTKQRLDDLGYL
ncbi:MAG: alkaline phosphatase family protein [Salinirussus sp.]